MPNPLIELALASSRLHPDDIADAVARAFERCGARDSAIYLADIEQRWLVRLGPGGKQDRLAVDGTLAGRAYRTETVVVGRVNEDADAQDGAAMVWMPLLDSAERYGVISLVSDAEVTPSSLQEWHAITNLVGEIVANKSQYGDTIATTRRTRDVTLAAEMRWSMLPPLTFTGRNIAISGIVAPAYEIAGDTFDYAVNGDLAHVAIIDAVGHGLEAARIANLAVGAYRHSRRHDLDLVRTYEAMDRIVADQFGAEKFATAQLATLVLPTGELRWVNAGHPRPLVIRRGHHFDLPSEAALPVGLATPTAGLPSVAQSFLEPGDLLLFFTDGIVEARSRDGEEFGRDRLADLAERAAAAVQRPAETVRMLAHAVLEHQTGDLQDDATLLLVSWDGPVGS